MVNKTILPKLFILLVLMLTMSAFASAEWWNTSWTKSYPINVTVTYYERIKDTIWINTTSFSCANADQRDLRIVNAAGVEIPYSVVNETNGNKQAVVTMANASVGTNYLWGTAYCYNTGATYPNYEGFEDMSFIANNLLGSGTPELNITTDPVQKTSFHMYNGFIGAVMATAGFSNPNAAGSGRMANSYATNGPAFKYGVTLTQTCVMNVNTSQYIAVECINAANAINVTYHFYYGQTMFGTSFETSYSSSVGEFTSASANAGTSQKLAIYKTSTGAIANTSGSTATWDAYGMNFFYDGANPWVYGQIWNLSAMSATTMVAYIRTNANDPDGCLWATSTACNGQVNLADVASKNGVIWHGYANSTSINGRNGLNSTFLSKMNPILVSLGAEESLTSKTAPTVAAHQISPTAIYDSNATICNATIRGDNATITVAFRWFNGTNFHSSGLINVVNNTATSISTQPAANTSIGETWTCEVTANTSSGLFSTPSNASKQVDGVLFNFSAPTDITTWNLLDYVYYNTTYKIYSSLGYANNTIKIFAKTNTTQSDDSYYYNGTVVRGYYQMGWSANNSENYLFRLGENGLLRGTYNKLTDDTTTHQLLTFGSSNQRLIQQILNISSNTQFNVLEFMINATDNAEPPLVVRYCNSSFIIANGNDPIGNANCGICGSFAASTAYGHAHSANSKHNNITIPINITNGYICGVRGTSNGSFAFSSSSPNSWNAYYTDGATRLSTWGYTANGGGSWTTDTGTLDMHLHQYSNTSIHYEYACYNDSNGQQCSAVRNDPLDIGTLPPIPPLVTLPSLATYSQLLPMAWTPAYSITGQQIASYNLTILYNGNASTAYYIGSYPNTTTSVSFCMKSGLNAGTYLLRVDARDNNSQLSSGYSSEFNYSYSVNVTSNYPATNAKLNSQSVQFNCSIAKSYTENLQYISLLLFNKTVLLQNITVSNVNKSGIVLINATVADAMFYNYSCVVYINGGSCSDIVITANKSFTLDSTAPSISIQTPTSGQIFNQSLPVSVGVNFTARDGLNIVDKCWYSLDGNTSVITTGCANFTLNVGSFGGHSIVVYANDTYGNINSTSVSFVVGILSVTQIAPPDLFLTNKNTINLSCLIIPQMSNVTAGELRIYKSGAFVNLTRLTSVYAGNVTLNATNVILSSDGNYTWYCLANSSDGSSSTSTNRSFYSDTTSPNITILSPPYDYWTNTTSSIATFPGTGFAYTCNDTLSVRATNYTLVVPNGTIYYNTTPSGTVAITDYYGVWTLNVSCVDTANNTAIVSRPFAFGAIVSDLSTTRRVFNSNFTINVTNHQYISSTANCTVASNLSEQYFGIGYGNVSLIGCEHNVIGNGAIKCWLYDYTGFGADGVISTYLSCRDGNYLFNATAYSTWIDAATPQVYYSSFVDSQTLPKGFNVTGQWNFTDSNLFRINVTENGRQLFALNDINLTKYTYYLNYNTSSSATGRHNLSIKVYDSHTAKSIDPYKVTTPLMAELPTSRDIEYPALEEYEVSKPLFTNKLVFETPTKNRIEIEAMDEPALQMASPFETRKLVDRYTFAYKPSEPTADNYSFKISTKEPIYIIDKPGTYLKKWMVAGNNWIDFYTPNMANATVTIELVDKNHAIVTVAKPKTAIIVEKDPIKDDGKTPIIETPIAEKPSIDKIEFYSIGDLNVLELNYTFYTYTVSMVFDPAVVESELQSTSVSLDLNGTPSTGFTVYFEYDGVNKTVVTNYNDTNPAQSQIISNATFATPLVTATEVKEGRWYLNFLGTNLLIFNQTVYNMGFVNCSVGSENISLTICGIDEESLLNVSNMTLDIDFSLWLGTEAIAENMHFGYANSNCYSFCLNPPNTSFNVYSIMQYGDGVEYTDRKYYLYNLSLNTSSPSFVWLYHLNTSLASVITYNVISQQTGLNVPDAYIRTQRYYPELNQYVTTEIEKTDQNGKAIAKMRLYDVFYREIVDYPSGWARLQTGVAKLAATTKVLAISLGTDLMASFSTVTNTRIAVGCNPTLGMCNTSWATLDGSARTIRLDLYESTGVSNILINSTTTTIPASSGQLFLYANPYKNNTYYMAKAYIIGSEIPAGVASMNNRRNIFSQEGNEELRLASLIPLVLLTITLICVGVDFGVVGVTIGSISGIVVGMLTTIIPIGLESIISLVILAGILIYKMVK